MSVEIVDGRFVLDPVPPRIGGTGHVHRARDHRDGGRVVAVKLYDGSAIDDELRQECFLRERAALQAITHPNIVRFVAAGHDETRRQHYLALEWIEQDVVGYLGGLPNQSLAWSSLARVVVRPMLLGLTAAHARRVMHRDIKPANVMVGDDGTVKLTDFGVAKLLDSVRFGMTVAELHSRPYAAPERDAGEPDFRSDLYSLGVTVIDLLSGVERRLDKEADPRAVLAGLDLSGDAQHFLYSLVAVDPDDRPLTAKLALTELDRILAWDQPPGPVVRPRLRVALTATVLQQGQALLGVTSGPEVRRRLLADLCNEPATLARDRRAAQGWTDESAVPLDLVGQELLFSAAFDRDGSGTLVLRGLRAVPPNLLERRREDGLVLEHQLVFEGRVADAREQADAVIDSLARHDVDRAQAKLERSETELFERWRSVLEAKTDLESRREDPIPYHGARRDGDMVFFTVNSEIDETFVEQTRRVPIPGGGAVVGTIAEVGDGEIGFAIERGNASALPDRGQLLIERVASRRAIERQKRALADVRDSEGARSDLGELLVHPERAAPLQPLAVGPFLQDLDQPKQRAVETALASPDFTLVEGPPGTGKTTFIAELIAQLLISRPDSRVLLSSQTHVAVDNAAIKLASLADDVRMVRVGRPERVDEQARHLTVAEQLRRWHTRAARRARNWLDDWGQRRGISAAALEAYALAAELGITEQGIDRLTQRLDVLAADEERLLDRLTEPDRPSPSSTSTGELVSDEEDELAAVQDEAEDRSRELQGLGTERERLCQMLTEVLGVASVPSGPDLDLALAERFPVDADDLEVYRRLLALQDEWLIRFDQGDDFTDALLASAQVVAGTCIGLASELDDQDVFDLAIVDEVSKATPTEALVPMVRSRRWVLVGDEQQLPPYVDGELIDQGLLEAHGLQREDLEEALFSQLSCALPEDRRQPLSEQHRMLSPIGELVSQCFYGGRLRSSRPDRSDFKCLETFPAVVSWYSTAKLPGRREKKVGTTYWNESELRLVRKLLNRLQQSAQSHDEHIKVAVITGYGEQARRLHRDLRPHDDAKWTHVAIDVHPVDSFQGQQRHVVIYSVTRSNRDNVLGFLRSERRINVALSRAQDALVIVGDARFCARARGGDNPFAMVLDHIRNSEHCTLEEPQR